jgi:LmbE family N-acetylglucosaminyl deacetylase
MLSVNNNVLMTISPHLDDAVFSCGDLIAAHPGSIVVTAFAGIPSSPPPLTDWDAVCGFHDSREAVPMRRREDRDALKILRANAVWLDYPDSQYGGTPAISELLQPLTSLVREWRPQLLLIPLGLFHSDHLLTSDTMFQVFRQSACACLSCYAYEEIPYRKFKGAVQARLSHLLQAGFELTPASFDVHVSVLKHAAIERYRSQLRGLNSHGRPGYQDVYFPERYWRVQRQVETHD